MLITGCLILPKGLYCSLSDESPGPACINCPPVQVLLKLSLQLEAILLMLIPPGLSWPEAERFANSICDHSVVNRTMCSVARMLLSYSHLSLRRSRVRPTRGGGGLHIVENTCARRASQDPPPRQRARRALSRGAAWGGFRLDRSAGRVHHAAVMGYPRRAEAAPGSGPGVGPHRPRGQAPVAPWSVRR